MENIGILNEIFFQNIEEITKRKDFKKIIKEYVDLFKKDKDLNKVYKVFNYIENIKSDNDIKEHVNEAIEYIKDINKNKIVSLTENFSNFLEKYNITKKEDVKKESLYESINNLIFYKNDIKNIPVKINSIDNIKKYINENKQNINETHTDSVNEINISNSDLFLKLMVEKFNNKYKDQLTEEDSEKFKKIINSYRNNSQETIFIENKKECLTSVNNILKEDIDINTKERLLALKENLLEQSFNKETFIEDIASFVELNNTLNEI